MVSICWLRVTGLEAKYLFNKQVLRKAQKVPKMKVRSLIITGERVLANNTS